MSCCCLASTIVRCLRLQVKLAAVEPRARAVQAKIRSLKPHTISWSNVCDYYHPADFHAMAKACSAPEDTVHHLHSMNWIRDVKGASCIELLLTADGSLKGAEVTPNFRVILVVASHTTHREFAW
jgi:hypothetical protein